MAEKKEQSDTTQYDIYPGLDALEPLKALSEGRKHEEDFRARRIESRLNAMDFFVDIQPAKEDSLNEMSITVYVPIEDVEGEYTFTMPRKEEIFKQFNSGRTQISYKELEEMGFIVNGEEFIDKNTGDIVEARIRVIYKDAERDINDAYITTLTRNLESHWQNGHSHKSFIEVYWVLKGTLRLVWLDDEDDIVRVAELTKVAEDEYEKITYGITQDSQRIEEKKEVVYDPVIETPHHAPHNVWMSRRSVIGTSKVLRAETTLEPGEKDWNPEPEFDARIRGLFDDEEVIEGIERKRGKEVARWSARRARRWKHRQSR